MEGKEGRIWSHYGLLNRIKTYILSRGLGINLVAWTHGKIQCEQMILGWKYGYFGYLNDNNSKRGSSSFSGSGEPGPHWSLEWSQTTGHHLPQGPHHLLPPGLCSGAKPSQKFITTFNRELVFEITGNIGSSLLAFKVATCWGLYCVIKKLGKCSPQFINHSSVLYLRGDSWLAGRNLLGWDWRCSGNLCSRVVYQSHICPLPSTSARTDMQTRDHRVRPSQPCQAVGGAAGAHPCVCRMPGVGGGREGLGLNLSLPATSAHRSLEWQVYMDTASAANMLWDHGNNRSSPGSGAASFFSIRHERNNFRCQKRISDNRKHFSFHALGSAPKQQLWYGLLLSPSSCLQLIHDYLQSFGR